MNWLITEEDAGMTINDYLSSRVFFSSRLIKRAKSAGNLITVNGEKKTVRYVLEAGDELSVIFSEEERGPFMTPSPIELNIVYEDDYIIVIDKKAGMLTIPSKRDPVDTVANALIHYYDRHNLPYTAHIITRLDRDTSGLLLVAKHQYSHSLFSNMQREGKIDRRYKAIVHGILAEKEGKIKEPIGRHPDSIIERAVRRDGQEALTYYKVEKEFASYSLVNIELKTGRTHQIRVHMSHLGHPLLGDDLYGGEQSSLQRQALHCSELEFTHPFTKEIIKVTSPLHDDLESFIKMMSCDQ